ncbi:hypothetical protein [Spirosoma oryzicola]|uniref:hypothetical protein n=1 Tax=Spirosoma oryzicola TaxID=2898794 RepID=UPI001E3B8CB2|nr:hypothetical protein [Spirosoma oryzicola]UHG92529.1 hypothetical protein LQ777_06380 [Spirosoma oryzicola]
MKILFTFLFFLPAFLFAQDATLDPLPMQERYTFTTPVDQDVITDAALKASPHSDAKVLLMVPKGSIVHLTGRDNGFYRATYDNEVGFIHFAFIDGDYKTFKARKFAHDDYHKPVDYANESNSFQLYGKVNVESPLKAEPSFSARTIYAIPEGTMLKVTKHNATYWRTEIDGKVGYVGNSFIAATGKTPQAVERSLQPAVETSSDYSSYTTTRPSYRAKPSYRPKTQSRSSSSSSQYYIRGPRGGCYYLTASGRKQYVDRSMCD